MEDSFGLNIADELRKYALQEDIEMKPIAVYSDLSNIVNAIHVIKSTPFNCKYNEFVFCRDGNGIYCCVSFIRI